MFVVSILLCKEGCALCGWQYVRPQVNKLMNRLTGKLAKLYNLQLAELYNISLLGSLLDKSSLDVWLSFKGDKGLYALYLHVLQ